MKREVVLAFCYDFYNDHLLKDQNDDISYYKNLISKYLPKKILVVGAGTGRVAIPLSQISKVDVLDFDIYRLERLNKKKKLNSYCMNFCNEMPKEKYDMVIMPYSTIQSLFDYNQVKQFIKNAFSILNKNGKLIFDVSESFNTKENTKDLILFEDYAHEIDSDIMCRFNSKRLKNKMKFSTEFIIKKYGYSVFENETYLYYDESKFTSLVKEQFELLKIDDGYGKSTFLHKHIYHCNKGGK